MEATTLSRREGVVVGFFWIVVVAVALMTVYQVSTGGAARTEQDEHPEAGTETLEKKIADLQAAVQASPGDLRSLVALGDTYLDARRGQEALTVLLQAEALAPDDTHILSDLGSIYQQTGRYEEALARFTRIVELDPTQVGARVHVSLIYQGMGKMSKALETLQAALALNPEPRYANMIRKQIAKIEAE